MRSRLGFLVALFAAAYIGAAAAALLKHGVQAMHAEQPCETDSECMRHCPPPADDPDCDGGPQEPGSEREQARLCAIDSAHCDEVPQ